MNLKILLIAYKFPPYAGVGGYRWSKLAKHLAALGVEVHVVTVDWEQISENSLVEDTISDNIIIYRIPCNYPHNFRTKKFNSLLVDNLKKLILRVIDQVIYWDDEAQYWGRDLLPFCEKLVRDKNIKTVIATGHPFQSLRHASELKRRIPKIKFIADFRDPWFQHRQAPLIKYRARHLRTWVQEVMLTADLNVFVTRGLISHYLALLDPSVRELINVAHIQNGVDIGHEQTARSNEMFDHDFIHAGNITNGREEPLRRFLLGLQKIAPTSSVLLVGVVPIRVLAEFSSLKNLIVSDPVSQDDVFSLIKKSRYALQLNAQHVPYSVSTKIYEYPALGRPVISVNYGGEVAELVWKYKLGYSLRADSSSFESELAAIINSGPISISFPPSFSYQSVAQYYLERIQQLHQ